MGRDWTQAVSSCGQSYPRCSQAVTFAESTRCRITSKMVLKSGANWKRPVNRMYAYNFPMTDYLEAKTTPTVDLPGPLCFSERIALHPLSGTSVSVYADQSLETIKKSRQVIASL